MKRFFLWSTGILLALIVAIVLAFWLSPWPSVAVITYLRPVCRELRGGLRVVSQDGALGLFGRVRVDTLFFPPDRAPALPHEYQFNLDDPAGREALNRMLAFLDSIRGRAATPGSPDPTTAVAK
jgi:hypothetical protein